MRAIPAGYAKVTSILGYSRRMRLILVAALGYFVDIIDLFLFSVLRVPSLKALGVPDDQLLSQGIVLLNSQMAGLLIGSLFWGILGDRKGRVSVLYGSILLYSLATFANGFVASVETYAVLRFFAGIGLSGELGVAITLVCEAMPREKRGLGTTIVAGFGLCGGVAASLLAENFEWSTCYKIGGGAGLLLLLLRLGLRDSELFRSVLNMKGRGNLLAILRRPPRLAKYLLLILAGLPIWFVAGILMVFSPELGKELGVQGEVRASQAVLYSYIGVAIGDFMSGLLSQWLKSRKQALFVFLVAVAAAIACYLGVSGETLPTFYVICFGLGISTGYWAVLITTASEHFGTDLRATVTTTVPNFIRASTIPLTFLFQQLSAHTSKLQSAAGVGTLALVLAFISVWFLDETFDKSLAFTENPTP
jgi:MFS family permease